MGRKREPEDGFGIAVLYFFFLFTFSVKFRSREEQYMKQVFNDVCGKMIAYERGKLTMKYTQDFLKRRILAKYC